MPQGLCGRRARRGWRKGGFNKEVLDANLFVLTFQTRWCRGGKGKRKLALQLLAVLYERGYREAVLAVTELLPSYGYWKDLLLLLLECKRTDVDYTPLHSSK